MKGLTIYRFAYFRRT